MRALPILVTGALVVAGASILPVTAASAAGTVTITGTVTALADGAFIDTDVNWVSPLTGKSGTSVPTNPVDGTFSLTVPASTTSFYLTANLDSSGSTVTDGYAAEFVGAGGHEGLAYQLISPYATAAASTVGITLVKTGKLTGTSTAIANQTLSLLALDGSYIDSVAVGPNGVYTFPKLAPGAYKLSYSGFNSALADFTSAKIVVTAGGTTTYNPTIVKGAVVSGTVTLKHKAVKNATVALSSTDFSVYKVARTNSKGHFTIVGVPGGSYTTAVYTSPDKTPGVIAYSHRTGKIAVGSSKKLSIALTAAGGVKGTVPGHKGKLTWVAFVKGKESSPNQYVGGSKTAKVSATGLTPGTYTAYVVEQDGSKYGTAKVKVVAGRFAKLPKVTLNRSTVTLKGTVAGKVTGTAYATGTVTNIYSQAHISKGAFTIKGIIPGRTAVTVAANGYDYKATTLTLKKSAKHAFGKGAKLGKVTGTLTLGGLPLTDGFIQVQGKHGYYSAEITTGSFSFSAVAGTYKADIFSFASPFPQDTPFYVAAPSPTITVVSGKTTSLGSIALKVLGGL